jgi:hypothetical protein
VVRRREGVAQKLVGVPRCNLAAAQPSPALLEFFASSKTTGRKNFCSQKERPGVIKTARGDDAKGARHHG